VSAAAVAGITHVFFDVGGVLGSDAWDRVQRAAAVRRFGLDGADFEDRHAEAVGPLESGAMTMDEYLDTTIFHRERPFGREEFRAFMRAQSEPHPEVLALAGALAAVGRFHLMTINNESDELNRFRLRLFGLAGTFSAFFSSCWVGAVKPSRRIYETALAVSQAEPGRAVFIDDRARNLGPARALGMRVILFRDAGRLRADLSALGVPV
jgi:putative hydrolase of the HAD superfamily